MTAELRWIFLLLHFTAAAAGGNRLFVTVRDGDDVTLPCYAGTGDQRRCDDTTWTFRVSGNSSCAHVTVFEDGKFHADVRSKSDRLRVTEKCSLVIEKVSVDDAGWYDCRQVREGQQQGEAAVVYLSVVTINEQEVGGGDDGVILTCSVKSYYGWCGDSVQWLFDDEDKNMETSQFSCSDSVKIKTSEFNQKKKSLRCKVKDHYGNTEKLFEFKTQRSTGEEMSSDQTTTNMMTSVKTTNCQDSGTVNVPPGWWWQRLVVVAAGLAALITSVLTVNIWMRRKGTQTQTEGNTLRDDDADEEEGEGSVLYENIGEPSSSDVGQHVTIMFHTRTQHQSPETIPTRGTTE